jgi:membrane-anchored glycerophosphoryl diester phosphodiesterase (GDPDase)
LTKPLAYTRLSWKFIGRLLLIIVLAAIPAAIFLNPFWADISNDNSVIAVIIWITQSIGFFLAIIMILLVAPVLCGKAGFELFKSSEYLEKTKAKEGKEELEMSRSSGCD